MLGGKLAYGETGFLYENFVSGYLSLIIHNELTFSKQKRQDSQPEIPLFYVLWPQHVLTFLESCSYGSFFSG